MRSLLFAVAASTPVTMVAAMPDPSSGETPADARNPEKEQQLRKDLLSHLDPNVPPYTDGVSGVSVGTQLRIFKVLKVDTASGELQLKVRWRNTGSDEDEWFPYSSLWEEYQHLVIPYMEEHQPT